MNLDFFIFRKLSFPQKILSFVFLVCTVLSFNIGNVTSQIVQFVYPEYRITQSDLNTQKVNLKEFSILEDGSIYSTTVDPWIYIRFDANDITAPCTVDIDIENATNIGEAFLVYCVDSYGYEEAILQEGNNHIPLKKLSRSDNGIRLDLTANAMETIKINGIVFNDNQILTEHVCSKMRVLTIAYMFAGIICFALGRVFGEKMRDHNGEGNISFVSLGLFFIMSAPFLWQLSVSDLIIQGLSAGKIIVCLFLVFVYCAFKNKVDLYISAILYLLVHAGLQYALNDCSLVYYIKYELFNSTLALNLLLVMLLMLLLSYLLGKRLGNLVFYSVFAVYVTANLIKMKYQNALLSIADLSLGGEIIGIAKQYVSSLQILCIGCVATMLLIACIAYRKKLISFFKPSFSRKAIPVLAVNAMFFAAISSNAFQSVGVNVAGQYLTNKETINALGFGIYTLVEFSGNKNTGEPDGYSEDIVSMISAYKDTSTENDVKPTVILILAESLFEVEEIPDVIFNQKLLTNLEPYKVTDIISPSYGGRTAAAEFEALTGLSNLFLQGDVIPYTSYLNDNGHETGSLAREFGDNGYTTIAIHANRADYYSRDVVYNNMGFDDFISKEDFELAKSDYLKDELVRDEAFVDKILQVLDNTQDPIFIFGASLEGHSPYTNKYSDVGIVASSDKYDDDTLYELSCLGQSIYNLDQQLGRLIRYFEEKETPVLIYVFGDHLPPLSVYQENGYLDDNWLKYTTPLYAYSNFCDTAISMTNISLSQIAPEILRKAGIAYRPYYDYIYNLREKYPITHKSFVNEVMDSELQIYNMIQWDLLFGDRYLIQE